LKEALSKSDGEVREWKKKFRELEDKEREFKEKAGQVREWEATCEDLARELR
jgi:hypothetical protein